MSNTCPTCFCSHNETKYLTWCSQKCLDLWRKMGREERDAHYDTRSNGGDSQEKRSSFFRKKYPQYSLMGVSNREEETRREEKKREEERRRREEERKEEERRRRAEEKREEEERRRRAEEKREEEERRRRAEEKRKEEERRQVVQINSLEEELKKEKKNNTALLYKIEKWKDETVKARAGAQVLEEELQEKTAMVLSLTEQNEMIARERAEFFRKIQDLSEEIENLQRAAPVEGEAQTLYIKKIGNTESLHLNIGPKETTGSLKGRIWEQTGVSPLSQKLILGGKELQQGDNLNKLTTETTVSLRVVDQSREEKGEVEKMHRVFNEQTAKLLFTLAELFQQSSPLSSAQITKNKMLGHGACGEVFEATYHVSPSFGLPVAAKELFPMSRPEIYGVTAGSLEHQHIINSFYHEVDLLQGNPHPHIVTCFGYTQQTPSSSSSSSPFPFEKIPQYMLLDCGWGTVKKVLMERGFQDGSPQSGSGSHNRRLTNGEIYWICKDVLEGLSFLHTKKIIHRDIKPDNILLFSIGERLIAKLGDLGFGHQLESKSYARDHGGAIFYMAPEAKRRRNPRIESKSDMYSFGVVLGEMIQHEVLDEEDRDVSALQELLPESSPFKSLAMKCLVKKVEQRVTAAEALGILTMIPHQDFRGLQSD